MVIITILPLPPPPQWQHMPPPPCSPYEAFMDWLQRYETQIPQYEAANPPAGQGQHVPPPPLTYDAITAKDWLDSVIDAFDDMELEDSDRVKIASRLLDEDGKAWWRRISGKFLALKRGDMSVSEYDNKLRRLFRHMPGGNEDLLFVRFVNGLIVDLQSSISSLITDTTRTVPYSHLVDTAKQAELVTQAAPVVRAHRMGAHMVALLVPHRHLGLANLPRGLILIISLQGGEVFARIAATTTMDLARFPLSVFSAVVGITFVRTTRIASGREASRSGSNTRDRVQTQLYTMTREAAQDNPNSIMGIVTLFRKYARALIDIGAEHSYVSYEFAQYANIPLSPLFPELIVQTPFAESLLKTEVYRECALLVGHMVFEADLIPLEIYDFDVNLGMDWWNKHGAQIDCETKTMMLKKPDFPVIKFQGMFDFSSPR
ncbi:Retroviral aspartyl protease [Corchorus olitorius]|uniref:Retroviral aspartyl protease n=1 Tax=Corchorus olitorius TaxID=93759 RepID=A0A1R3FVJ6_9ROSI|nr:Retroviral aspartyl protease [Corchorus olitorius]